MTRKIIIAFFALLLFASCSSDHKSHQNNTEEIGINLNDGDKWNVNAEMVPFIENGEELLSTYISQNDDGYQKLAEGLKEQNSALIKSCTMKGESHDELHKWLHPHLEMVKNLSKAEQADEAEKIIEQLQASFKTYHRYFE